MASASDNFNRTENPLSDGGAWTTGVYNSNNNKTTGSAAAGVDSDYAFAIRNSPTFSADHYSEAVFDTSTTSQIWLIVRASGTGASLQFYGLLAQRQDSDALFIYKYTNGSGFVQLAQVSGFTPSDGTYRLEVSGTSPATLTGYFNGVSKLTITDSSFASGQPGFGTFESIGELDDWAASDLVAATPFFTQLGYTRVRMAR